VTNEFFDEATTNFQKHSTIQILALTAKAIDRGPVRTWPRNVALTKRLISTFHVLVQERRLFV